MTDMRAGPKLLVLPRESTDNARILTLAHPRTRKPCRYYFDLTHGIYELTRIVAPKAAHRSWFLRSQSVDWSKRRRGNDEVVPVFGESSEGADATDELFIRKGQNDNLMTGGYVVKDAELLVATAMDPIFMLLPSLNEQKLFLSADDLLDQLSEESKHFREVIRNQSTQRRMNARLGCICDIVHAGSEEMYRLSEEKLVAELLLKAERMVASSLPSSMEERYIRRTLETPLVIAKCDDSSSKANGSVTPMSEATVSETVESQTSTATMGSAATSTSAETEITVPEGTDATDSRNLNHLLRLRTALSFMISSYVPTSLAASITARLTSEKSPIDFKPLDDRLAEIAKLRAAALAARSFDDFSHKRSMHEEDDAAESRIEKKRRKEEDEKKRKAGETRGVRDLKKVDTTGMKKMSDFFGKRVSPRKKKQ